MRRIDHRIGSRHEAPRARLSLARGRAALPFAAVFLALAFSGAVWLWRSGLAPGYAADVREAAVAVSADLGLFVREIRIAGNRHVAREVVLAEAGLRIGAPIFASDPAAIRARLERMAWIERAVVSRLLPGTLAIEIVERRPFALWQRDGALSLIDETGAVLTDRDLHRFAGLPLIVGARALRSVKQLFATLATEPDLGGRVEAVIRVGERRWDLRLDNGIDVRLPEAGEEAAWRRLAQLARRHALLARRITAIDLRIPERIVVTGGDAAGPLSKGQR